jgi:DNA (cytosine-5)-methyltransferase 1
MMHYYNENDPFAAAWLRNLIAAGRLPQGEVDDRSILEVQPSDLAGFSSCHFFAGIGGWPYALRLAGWPDERPVWTGSCPCQPLSVAGKGRGHADQRHLWPAFFGLIAECRPPVVFGEQVASALGWVAHPSGARLKPSRRGPEDQARDETRMRGSECGRGASGVADATHDGLEGRGEQESGKREGGTWRVSAAGDGAGFWSDLEWLPCVDGKARPTQPGLFPLAHGVSGRVGRLRAYGNAIVPPLAAQFVTAFDEVNR